MKLIVGLGNPGEKYQGTRHNLGFEVVDELWSRVKGLGFSWKLKKEFKAEIIQLVRNIDTTSYIAEFANQFLTKDIFFEKPEQISLVKPMTYMNNSGMAVKLLATYYKLPVTDIIIIHDEVDLPLGKIKVRIGGAAAGHHGVESIIRQLADDKFIRVKVGIGPVEGVKLVRLEEHRIKHGGVEKFVLQPFATNEKSKVKKMIKQAAEAAQLILEKGLETAQNQYN